MKKLSIIIAAALSLLSLAISCNEPEPELPASSGETGEVIVIATKGQWESEVGNALRSVLTADYPYLPQTEPLFRVSNIPPQSFNHIFKVNRNIVVLKIEDTCSTAMQVRRNVWARPQTVVSISAPSEDAAVSFIAENGSTIVDTYEKAERSRAISNAKEFPAGGVREFLLPRFGGSPYFPKGYSIKKQTDDFVWISNETAYTNQGIFLYKFPYEGSFQLTPAYLVSKRDAVMKDNVPATAENSYMITNPMIAPGYAEVTSNDIERKELRGLWDTYNDYMGGPFLQHAIVSKDSKEVIVVEGFVYAPRYDKRNYLRGVEAIVYSFDWE